MKQPQFAVRMASLGLAACCFYLASAGLLLYRADCAYKRGEYKSALAFSEQVLKLNGRDLQARYLQGLSYWKQRHASAKGAALEAAELAFSKLTEDHPHFAKGWYFRALCRISLNRRTGENDSFENQKIETFLETARTLEPGSPWMNIQTALETLRLRRNANTESDPAVYLKRLRRYLRAHYPNQASPYLETVLKRLSDMGYSSEALKQVTPKDEMSYFRLLEFFKLKGDFQAYSLAEPRYKRLRSIFYSGLCDQADGWLENGQRQRANAAYAFAQQKQPANLRASAGLLASRLASGPLTLNESKRLEEMLLQDEEDLSFYWDYLEGLASQSQSSLIRGLIQYRKGNYEQAVKILKLYQSDHPDFSRRYLAQAMIESGRLTEARDFLKPALEEPQADLRDLLLLERLADIQSAGERKQVQSRIAEQASRKVSREAWQVNSNAGQNQIEAGELAGTALNFNPGRVRVMLLLKLENSVLPQQLSFRVYEKDREQWSACASLGPKWERKVWEFETTGGWRWIQLSLLPDPRLDHAIANRSRVRLGWIQVESPE